MIHKSSRTSQHGVPSIATLGQPKSWAARAFQLGRTLRNKENESRVDAWVHTFANLRASEHPLHLWIYNALKFVRPVISLNAAQRCREYNGTFYDAPVLLGTTMCPHWFASEGRFC
jgi:hypothetical protein